METPFDTNLFFAVWVGSVRWYIYADAKTANLDEFTIKIGSH